jgi:hypothetical protein
MSKCSTIFYSLLRMMLGLGCSLAFWLRTIGLGLKTDLKPKTISLGHKTFVLRVGIIGLGPMTIALGPKTSVLRPRTI